MLTCKFYVIEYNKLVCVHVFIGIVFPIAVAQENIHFIIGITGY